MISTGKRLSLAILATFAQAGYAEEQKQHFSIPAQPLASALQALAAQSGAQMLYAEQTASGKQGRPVIGDYTMREALDRLLAGSGLVYQVTDSGTVTIRPVGSETSHADSATLPAMHVTASAEYDPNDPNSRDYAVPNASTGTKTDTPLMETPMSVQVVPKAVLDDQQAIRLEDALKNVSGVVKGFGFGTLEDTFIIRGFENSTNNWGLTQIYRDGSLSVGALFSTADVQRIEVLKGPAAMLYGRLEPGGLINVTTKRPRPEAAYSIQQQFGSYDTYRTTLGATGSLTQDGSLMYRLDFEYLDKNSFRDYTFNEQAFVSPKLTWKVTDRTQIDLEYQYFDQETVIDWGIPAVGNRPADIPINRYFGEPTDRFPHQAQGGGITLTHDFTEDWKVQAKYFKFNDQYAMYSGENSPSSLNEATGELSRSWYAAPHDFNSDFVTLKLTGKFTTWGIDHTLLIGGDWFDSSFTEDGVFLSGANGPGPINTYNPIYGNGIVDTSGLPDNSFAKVDDKWYGFYLQDQAKFAENWHLLAGFRYDNAKSSSSFNEDRSDPETSSDSEFSPRVGLLYQPLSWLSVYGSYMEGFNGAVTGRTVDNSSLQPNQSRQYEAGFKTDWLDGKLTSSLVFYHLTKKNLLTAHSDPSLAAQGYVEQTGEAESRGIEFDIQGQVAENWDVIGSYALTDTEVTKDQDASGGSGNQGNRLYGVPTHSGSLWGYHRFGEFDFPELSAGLGVFMVGQREGDRANSFQLPGYARVDAALKYVKHLGPTNLTVQFNIQNLLDKHYYASARPNRVGITPGEPITFLGSVKLDF
jgi:iron complex outermembrane receptor protein